MQRYSSALVGAVTALAVVASSAPALAGSPHAAPAVINGDQTAGIQNVGDRHDGRGRHKGHRSRGHDNFIFGFSLGAPYAYYPRARAYPVYQCPYGTWFDGRYCVAYRHHPQPYYHRAPSFSFHLGF